MRASGTLLEAAPAAGVGPTRATSVGIRLGPSCRRPDVVTGKDGVAPTPLQVKYYAPDDQSDNWGENDQETVIMISFRRCSQRTRPKRVCGYERCLDYLHRQEIYESSRDR